MIPNRLKVLLAEYSVFYASSIRTEGLILSLEKLPSVMILKEGEMVASATGMPTVRNKTVEMRLKELRIEYAIFGARLETAKEMIEKEQGGKETLKEWVWEETKNE